MRSISNFFLDIFRKLCLPFLGWTLYIIYEQATIYVSQGKLGAVPVNLFYYALNILLFYSERAILNRCITRNNPHYWKAILYSLLLLTFFLALKTGINYFTYRPQITMLQALKLMNWDLFRCLFFIGLSTLVWVTAHIEIFRKDAETVRLIADRDKALLESRVA